LIFRFFRFLDFSISIFQKIKKILRIFENVRENASSSSSSQKIFFRKYFLNFFITTEKIFLLRVMISAPTKVFYTTIVCFGTEKPAIITTMHFSDTMTCW